MKKIRKYIYLLLIFSYVSFTSCEDFALGEKFLQKPPSGDVTIDTIFRRQSMPGEYYGMLIRNCLMAFLPVIIIRLRCVWVQ